LEKDKKKGNVKWVGGLLIGFPFLGFPRRQGLRRNERRELEERSSRRNSGMIMIDSKVVGGEKVGAWMGDLRANECGERNRKIGFQKP
jgi:hypothetical protein